MLIRLRGFNAINNADQNALVNNVDTENSASKDTTDSNDKTDDCDGNDNDTHVPIMMTRTAALTLTMIAKKLMAWP